jgi:hypothetical protein
MYLQFGQNFAKMFGFEKQFAEAVEKELEILKNSPPAPVSYEHS